MSQNIKAKKTAVVICPGRGTYNADELGYLSRHHGDKSAFIDMIDRVRVEAGQEPISEIDSAQSFSSARHGSGENASLLIYACAMADFFAINRDEYDIAAVTGNSMGWYLSLAAGGALSLENGARLVNGMGQIMTQHGTRHLMSELPKEGVFPLRLRGHSAFHSPQLNHIVPMAKAAFAPEIFSAPDTPLIDGQGNIWPRFATDTDALYDYTLGRQINGTYDFTRAVQVAAKEFAPDVFIVLGPGGTMGAPTAQSLIAMNWHGLTGKTDFQKRNKDAPLIISMGREDQRALVTK